MQNVDIIMSASSGKLSVRQVEMVHSIDVPYDGKSAQLYRVRKTWDNIRLQNGAYSSLYNAKEAADKAGGAYSVFD